MDLIGKSVHVKVLGENGTIISVKKNLMGEDVYRVKTDNFDSWATYKHEFFLI